MLRIGGIGAREGVWNVGDVGYYPVKLVAFVDKCGGGR